MVGVAGKSKACITCKKRRVKCDEGKPKCKRCEKAGYACAGYSTGLQFVNTSTAPFRQKQDQSSSSDIQYVGNTPVRVVPRMRTTGLPTELSLVAFESTFRVSFLMHNFVWRTYGNGWLEPAAQEQLDPLCTQSVKALSEIFFGVFHHQEDIQMRAVLDYGKALSLLRSGLAEPQRPGVENLVIPVLVLLMHASYEEDQAAAVSHVKGLIMLLHVAGPYRFQHDPIRKAFASARATLATSFILARQPLFLAQEEWKVTPWALDPWSKNQQNQLTDILVDVPGFLAADDKLQQHDDPEARETLLERIKSSLYALYFWRFTWEALYPTSAYETIPTPGESRVIPRRLRFRAHEQAGEILLYNAIQLFLLGLLNHLSDSITLAHTTATLAATTAGVSLETVPRGTLRLPDDIHSIRDPAIEICRAFEFTIEEPDKNRESNLFFLFPLGIAWEVLKDEEDFRGWIRSMLDQTPVTSGYAVGRNRWFGKYYLPKPHMRKMLDEPILRSGHGRYC